jgi:hypothetical protein
VFPPYIIQIFAHGRCFYVYWNNDDRWVECKDKTTLVEGWNWLDLYVPQFQKKGIKWKKELFIQEFLRTRYLRRFTDEVYKPMEYFKYHIYNNVNTFNLWSGWKYKYDPKWDGNKKFMFQGEETTGLKLIDNIIQHYNIVFANRKKELLDFIFNIYSLILWGKKSGIMMVITGPEMGTGKSMGAEYFGEQIIGMNNYTYISNIDDATKQFTGQFENKSYCVMDEVKAGQGGQYKKNTGILKGLITQKVLKMEKKYQTAKAAESKLNLCAVSNDAGCKIICCENPGCRRFFLIEANPELKNRPDRKEYFAKLALEMGRTDDNKKALHLTPEQHDKYRAIGFHFTNYLMARDLSGFDKEKIPKTNMRLRAEQNAIPYHMRFLRIFLAEMKANQKYHKAHIFNYYKLYTSETGLKRYCGSAASLFRRFNEFELLKAKLQSVEFGGWSIKGTNGFYLKLKNSQIKELMNILDTKNGKLAKEDFEQKIVELNVDSSIYQKIVEYESKYHKNSDDLLIDDIIEEQKQKSEEDKYGLNNKNLPEAFKKAYTAKLDSNGKKQLNGDDEDDDTSTDSSISDTDMI